MSSSETDGITALRNFLSQSRIIEPKIAEGDKYPLWDGEILIYSNDNPKQKKQFILGRLPVQIKSAKVRKLDEEFIDYKIPLDDLRKYLADGGILFICPRFKNTIDYKIYIRLLLPKDLLDLINNHRNVTLNKIDDIHYFEALCNHFLQNRPLQSILSTIDHFPRFSKEDVKIVAKGITQGNLFDMLFSDQSYFYSEDNKGLMIPINVKVSEVEMFIKSRISIDDIKYFDFVRRKIHKEEQFVELNSSLFVYLIDNSINFKLNINDDVYFSHLLISIEFIEHFLKSKYFFIDNQKIEGRFANNTILDPLDINFIKQVDKILNLFRVEKKDIKLKDINSDNRNLNLLIDIFLNNLTVDSPNEIRKVFLKKINLINKEVLLLFRKQQADRYKGYNFCIDDLGNEFIIHDPLSDVSSPCSRFLALFTQNQPAFTDVQVFDGFFDEVEADLKRYYKNEFRPIYNSLMLAFINGYDNSSKIQYLILADKINELMANPEDPVFIINKFQIKLRNTALDDNDIKILLDMKEKSRSNIDLICGILILLENFKEFDFMFKQLSENQQLIFKLWPIWNLLGQLKNKDNS